MARGAWVEPHSLGREEGVGGWGNWLRSPQNGAVWDDKTPGLAVGSLP